MVSSPLCVCVCVCLCVRACVFRKRLEWWQQAMRTHWSQWWALHHCRTWPSLLQVTWTASCESSCILFRIDCIHWICWLIHPHGKICVWVFAYLTGNILQLCLEFLLSSSTRPHPLAEKSSLFCQLCPNLCAYPQKFSSVLSQSHLAM